MKSVIALILLSVYTVLQFAAYMPQIIKILRTKCADDLSMLSWFTWVLTDLCYLGYILLETPEIGIISVTVLDLLFIMTVYILTAYYQKHNKKCKRLKKQKR